MFPPQATRTGPLSTEQHTVEVKAAVGCFKRLTCQKSQSYSTENNMHASSFNTSLFFLLRPIIKRRKKKALHILKISFGIFFHFIFRNAHIPRRSLHHSLVLQGAALGRPWLEVVLNTLLTTGNILPHGEGRLQ